MNRSFLCSIVALALGGCATGNEIAFTSQPVTPVEVGLIALNDFHGALEPPRRTVTIPGPDAAPLDVPSGGAAWLASAVDYLRAGHTYSLTVAAGDMTGASQFASALFLDEPSVGVLNRIGLDLTSVGNHEFDRGAEELLRLQNGGCAKFTKREPCAVEPEFSGAHYAYLAANVKTTDGSTLLPGTVLRSFGEGAGAVTIGFIGLTLEGTALISSPGNTIGLSFLDEVEVINRAAIALEGQGADAIVVLIHEGVIPGDQSNPDGCPDPAGALPQIIRQLDARVDLVISGHTHKAYICSLPGADGAAEILVTSAGSQGVMLTDITLSIDPLSGAVVSHTARNMPVQSQPFRDFTLNDATPRFAPRADIADYVALYTAAAAEFSDRPVGRLAGPATFGKLGGDAGPLGNLIADGQLAATRDAGAQIALMNPGGMRAPIEPAADGTVTFRDIFQTQPFGNTLVTMTLSGQEILDMLGNQLKRTDQSPVIPAVSQGFSFTFDLSQPIGERMGQVTLNRQALKPDSLYRVTTNSFMADGGDGFATLKQGRDRVIGPGDLDAMEGWLQADPPRVPPQEIRTRNLAPGTSR